MSAASDLSASAPTASGHASYIQILKSTLLIGGSTAINILFSIVRNKAAAMLLGPEGFGLMGLYNSVLDLTQAVAGLGVNSSAVRQVAEAAATGDRSRITVTTIVVRRVSIVLGLAGFLLLCAVSAPVARLTFGDTAHAAGVALVAIAILFRLVSGGQVALLQGLRRIADLARVNTLGAFLATLLTIPMLFFFGKNGIVPSLVAGAAVTLVVSWVYARRVDIGTRAVGLRETGRESSELVKLGLALMASGLVSVGSAYLIRLIVVHYEGIAAAGFYQAAWTLGGMYAGFILQAMGADFYPRLTAVCNDADTCNRLVNEQAQIGMLLAGPGLVATLTVTPLVVALFYSSQFHEAVEVLRWICLGMMLRIVSWPIGYIILAKGARLALLATEIAAGVVHVGLAWLLTKRFGVAGAGAAFFCLYVWHGLLVYAIVRRMTGFRWSAANLRLALVFLPAAAAVFAAFLLLSQLQATMFGLAVTVATGLHSLRMLVRLLPADALPAPLRAWVPKKS
ncbi:O-antigen translocase [Mesorhizobium sp. SP-1A]|uniref:O-antigen translocase n=1 Tax=Mesorhizobium sp. SP-1A TaxID=3077840 RepID=UPI0028F6D408|nr:O-antigen translocase [Mesorhizobium sp. SP-1A]